MHNYESTKLSDLWCHTKDNGKTTASSSAGSNQPVFNQSIDQFNSNLAAREPDSKWFAVEIIDKNSKRNKQCTYVHRCWERCVQWVRITVLVGNGTCRPKLINEQYFFARKLGLGKEVVCLSLVVTEVSRGGGGMRWRRQEVGLQISWKGILKGYYV